VRLLNNRANYGGTAIYGGSVDYCYLFSQNVTSNYVFDQMFTVNSTLDPDLSLISSDPYDVCLCNTINNVHIPRCDENNTVIPKEKALFPGQNFTVTVAIAGQRNGTVRGVVLARFATDTKGSPQLGPLQESQTINTTNCTDLTYAVFSNQKSEKVILTVQQSEVSSILPYYHRPLHLVVSLQPCPIGFELRKDARVFCDCLPMLAKQGFICHINNHTIQRPPGKWVGYYNKSSKNGT